MENSTPVPPPIEREICPTCNLPIKRQKRKVIKYGFKKFDMNKIVPGKNVCTLGKKSMGKTTINCDIAGHLQKDIPSGATMTSYSSDKREYKKFFDESCIKNFDSSFFKKIIQKQQNEKTRENLLLVFENCSSHPSFWKDESIQHLIFNGRFDKITSLFGIQYALGLPPVIRAQFDFVFILRDQIVANRKRLYEHYAGMFPSFEIFSKVMDEFTNNYECLVIDNTVQSNNIEDMVFWYKADLHKEGDFKYEPVLFPEESQNVTIDTITTSVGTFSNMKVSGNVTITENIISEDNQDTDTEFDFELIRIDDEEPEESSS